MSVDKIKNVLYICSSSFEQIFQKTVKISTLRLLNEEFINFWYNQSGSGLTICQANGPIKPSNEMNSWLKWEKHHIFKHHNFINLWTLFRNQGIYFTQFPLCTDNLFICSAKLNSCYPCIIEIVWNLSTDFFI